MNQTALNKLLAAMEKTESYYLEREEVVRTTVLGILSRRSVFLLGPPGEAKTASVSYLANFLPWTVFETTLNAEMTLEDVFGPTSIPEFEKGNLVRNIDGRLPDATLGIVNELPRASGTVLDALLCLMSEGTYDNGLPAATQVLVATANHLPQGTVGRGADTVHSNAALFDRFPLRVVVTPVMDDDNWKAIMRGPEAPPAIDPSEVLTDRELLDLSEAIKSIELPDKVMDSLLKLRGSVMSSGIAVSTRRWQWMIQGPLRAEAMLQGRDAVAPEDFMALQHGLWTTPDQRTLVSQQIHECLPTDFRTLLDIRAQYLQIRSKVEALRVKLETASSTDPVLDVASDLSQERSLIQNWFQAIKKATGASDSLRDRCHKELEQVQRLVRHVKSTADQIGLGGDDMEVDPETGRRKIGFAP